MVLLALQSENVLEKYGDKMIDGNQFDDMAEYLFACDVLLSDYSGCVFDVALTEKPCFLFAHDRAKYEQEERGFYFQISKFPYDFSDTFDDLIESIKTFDPVKNNSRRNEFLDYIGNVEDGKAAERAADLVLAQCRK